MLRVLQGPPFDRYAVSPVARNAWQHLESRSPATATRCLISEHQQRIGEYLRLRAFDAAAGERLARFLEDEALRLGRTASLLAWARRGWLRDEHALAPVAHGDVPKLVLSRHATGRRRGEPSYSVVPWR